MTSSFVVRGECKICFEDSLELDSFSVLPCGHCFCGSCLRDVFSRAERRKAPCPLCRKHWLAKDASKLVFFPVIVDPTGSSVDHVIDGLNRMDKTCKTISVKHAHAKLTKAAEDIEEDNADRLRQAIEDFARRITPLFEELDLGRKRIQELEENQHTRFQDLTTKARRVDVLEREVASLRRSKAELQSHLNESLDSAEAFRVRAEDQQSRLTDVRKNLSAKEEEFNRVMDSLNRFKSSDTLKTKKLKALKQEVDVLNTKLQEKENMMDEQSSLMDLDQDHLIAATQPSLSSVRRHTREEGWITVDNNFQFEGMPAPGFKPSWGMPNNATKKANILLKKPQSSATSGGKKANSKFPISLDSKGRPTTAVQIGPKATLRAPQRF